MVKTKKIITKIKVFKSSCHIGVRTSEIRYAYAYLTLPNPYRGGRAKKKANR